MKLFQFLLLLAVIAGAACEILPNLDPNTNSNMTVFQMNADFIPYPTNPARTIDVNGDGSDDIFSDRKEFTIPLTGDDTSYAFNLVIPNGQFLVERSSTTNLGGNYRLKFLTEGQIAGSTFSNGDVTWSDTGRISTANSQIFDFPCIPNVLYMSPLDGIQPDSVIYDTCDVLDMYIAYRLNIGGGQHYGWLHFDYTYEPPPFYNFAPGVNYNQLSDTYRQSATLQIDMVGYNEMAGAAVRMGEH